MKTQTNKKKRELLVRYHTVCNAAGVSKAQKENILDDFGVTSSKDLTEAELIYLIEQFQDVPNMWRKRVIAAIGGWLKSINKEGSLEYIKSIACRSASYGNFNEIPVSRLQDIYSEFVRKQKTTEQTQSVKASIIYELEQRN